MIEINVWRHSIAPRKGSQKGLIIAGVSRANVGHANMVLTIKETDADIDRLKTKFSHLQPQELSIPVAEKNELSTFLEKVPQWIEVEKDLYPQINFEKGKFVVNEYNVKKVKGLEFVHSYWPTNTFNFKALFSRGVKPFFQTMEEDMDCESHIITYKDMSLKKPQINHLACSEQYDQKIEELKQKSSKLIRQTNDLQVQRALEAGEVNELTVQLDNLVKQLESEQQKYDLAEIELKNLNENPNNDATLKFIDDILITSNQSIISFHQKNISVLQEQIKNISHKLNLQNDYVEAIVDTIKANKEYMKKLNGMIDELMIEKKKLTETVGKHPDFTVTLPLKHPRDQFYLDHEAILKEMEAQRKNSKYHIFGTNCASSVKKCILAGISPSLKKAFINDGVPSSFFKNSFESPIGLLKWANKLNHYLTEINLKNTPSCSKVR